ncbi:TetR family transcriptional regulator [Blastococcus xanthinilyticus]|uniref:TetR family transcriptional regulator n=2 Tax=Blastococcus xanthinilyticus TaxID=1564164 RepID=A0A5S5D6W9_9ACTN|nr:TetR family transcriptional regulator [Blastococcus xanthinilyticus]
MQGLADEIGISRVTLFRWVGSREDLLGRVLWLLTERSLTTGLRRWEAERPAGAPLCAGTGRHVNLILAEATGLRRLLDQEPTLAIRVLTDPRGPVQPGCIAFVEKLLRRDMEESGLELTVAPGDLAYALVRLNESFVYADVLAARLPDVATATRLQEALILGSSR